MKLNNDKQIFNLMDTNGRRNDVVNALQGYLTILANLNGEWDNLPNSLSQYLFYKKAIELSPDVFVTHSPYDNLQTEINRNPKFKNAIEKTHFCNFWYHNPLQDSLLHGLHKASGKPTDAIPNIDWSVDRDYEHLTYDELLNIMKSERGNK